jgi:hypothetical protein
VTSIYKRAVSIGIIIASLSVSVYAQSAGPELSHFVGDVISFDHPAGYSVKDESTTEAQRLIITRKGSSVQLTIVANRQWTLKNELPAAVENLKEPLLKQVALTFGQGKNSPARTSFQTQVGPKQAEGIRLRSTGNKPRTGEVIWLRLKFRLVGFAFVRSDAHEAVGSELWQTVSSSLKVEALVLSAAKAGEEPTKNANTEARYSTERP